MNSRGGGYGMDAELARKAELKYDTAAEHEASSWLAAVTGISLSSDFAGSLKDGQILCMAINKIKPGTIRKIETSKMPFKQMENISNFLKACRVLGVAEHDLFETVDLFDAKDLGVVVMCLHALGGTIQMTQPQFSGPHLGKRKSGKGIKPPAIPKANVYTGMTKLSMGSSQTMGRSEIRQVMNPTFGAQASGTGTSNVVSKQSMGSSSTMPRSEVSTSNSNTFGADAGAAKNPPPPPPPASNKPPAPPVRQWGSNQRTNPNPTYHAAVNTTNSNNSYKPSVVGGGSNKARGGGYGMDAELAKKAELKYDPVKEKEAQAWIENLTGESFPEELSFGDALKDGVILAKTINSLKPGTIRQINASKMPFKQMENISNFLKACRVIGVNEFDLFETVDLFELKDVGLVVNCIHSLGRASQKGGLGGGKVLGAKVATANVRVFSEAQKRQSAVGQTKLSMGSSQTMGRTFVSTSNSNTFGADTSGTGNSSVMSKMSEGSSKIMPRSEVSVSNSNTFGADTSGMSSNNNAVPIGNLGSSGIMPRQEVSKSNNITFGAEVSAKSKNVGPQLARAEYDYVSQEAGELSLHAGETIKIMQMDGAWFDGCNSNGAKGSFPGNFVSLL